MIKKNIALFLVLLYTITTVAAYEAHEHGVGEMQILVEDMQIEIIVNLPGVDFIGFEHENLSDEEKGAIHEKIEELESYGDTLISFKTKRFMNVILKDLHVGDSEHEEGHEEGHEHEHMEFELHFTYSIDAGENIKSIYFDSFFKAFPTLSEVRWIMINESGQTAGKVDPSDSQINF